MVFLGPAFLFLAVALVAPTLRTIYLSLRGRRGEELVGADNYRSVFEDRSIFTLDGVGDVLTSRLFLLAVALAVVTAAVTAVRARIADRDIDLGGPGPVVSMTGVAILVVLAAVGTLRAVLWNNLYWVLFVTLVSTAVGLGIAVLADRARGESLAKSLIFMPMAISFVGAAIIWRFVYAYTPAGRDQIGLLNAVWVGAGGEPQAWIQQAAVEHAVPDRHHDLDPDGVRDGDPLGRHQGACRPSCWRRPGSTAPPTARCSGGSPSPRSDRRSPSS